MADPAIKKYVAESRDMYRDPPVTGVSRRINKLCDLIETLSAETGIEPKAAGYLVLTNDGPANQPEWKWDWDDEIHLTEEDALGQVEKATERGYSARAAAIVWISDPT